MGTYFIPDGGRENLFFVAHTHPRSAPGPKPAKDWPQTAQNRPQPAQNRSKTCQKQKSSILGAYVCSRVGSGASREHVGRIPITSASHLRSGRHRGHILETSTEHAACILGTILPQKHPGNNFGTCLCSHLSREHPGSIPGTFREQPETSRAYAPADREQIGNIFGEHPGKIPGTCQEHL